MYYISEGDMLNPITKKLNIIKLKGNNIILPIEKDEKIPEKKEIKLAKKTKKIINTLNSKKIIISKEIKKHEKYTSNLQTNDLEIINGKWLYTILLPEILTYITKKQNKEPEKTTIHILVNNPTEISINNIKLLSKKYKNITIITKHIEKFKKIEDQILEETGALIAVTNNKRKSLSKAQIIVNIDFPNEYINQYTINENSTIIDLYGGTKINKKRYNGIIIHDYEIEIKNKKEYTIDEKKYEQKEIYEAKFYKKQPIKYIREKLKKDGITITKLYTTKQII